MPLAAVIDMAPQMPLLRRYLIHVLPVMLLGILVGGLAPRGYMPSIGPAGVHLVLCTGLVDDAAIDALADDPDASALRAVLDGSRDKHGKDADKDGGMACPFAVGPIASLPAMLAAPDRLIIEPMPSELPPTAVVVARHRAGRPPATGPPQLI